MKTRFHTIRPVTVLDSFLDSIRVESDSSDVNISIRDRIFNSDRADLEALVIINKRQSIRTLRNALNRILGE